MSESNWENQMKEAGKQSTRSLQRHAAVSLNNVHRCQDCFCCAALTVIEDRAAKTRAAYMDGTVDHQTRHYIIINNAGAIIKQGYRFTPAEQAVIDEARRLWDEAKQDILKRYGL